MSDEQREAAKAETLREMRDRLVPVVQSYASAEGLSELGKIQAALRFGIEAGMAAKAEPVQIDRAGVRSAIARVLVNASNYPPNIGWRTLGVDMGPLINKSTDAILAALAAQPVTGTVEWGLTDSMLDTFPKPHFTASEECVRRNQRRGHPAIKVVRRTVTDWEEVN